MVMLVNIVDFSVDFLGGDGGKDDGYFHPFIEFFSPDLVFFADANRWRAQFL